MALKKKSPFAKGEKNLNIREKLGLSLREIADFCDARISSLSMVESGLRDWPKKAGDLIRQLQLAFWQTEPEPFPLDALPAPSQKEIEKIQKELDDLAIEQVGLGKKLAKMKFHYKQALALAKICRKLEPQFPDPESTAAISLRLWKTMAEIRLQKWGLLAQKKLEIEQEWRAQKAERLQALLESVAKGELRTGMDPDSGRFSESSPG